MPQSAKSSAPTDNTRFPTTSSVKIPVYSSGSTLPIHSYSSTITHSSNSSLDVTTSSHDFVISNISTSNAPETHGYPHPQISQETHPYSNTIAEQYESYFGCINDFYDAIVVVEAARIGKTRRIERRQDIPKNILRSGSVFVYSESESRILRWTDGRSWTPSRVSGNFLVYKETYRRDPTTQRFSGAPEVDAFSLVIPNGLVKKTATVYTSSHEKWVLCCYYREQDIFNAENPNGHLLSPSISWAKKLDINVPRTLYPKFDEFMDKEARKSFMATRARQLTEMTSASKMGQRLVDTEGGYAPRHEDCEQDCDEKTSQDQEDAASIISHRSKHSTHSSAAGGIHSIPLSSDIAVVDPNHGTFSPTSPTASFASSTINFPPVAMAASSAHPHLRLDLHSSMNPSGHQTLSNSTHYVNHAPSFGSHVQPPSQLPPLFGLNHHDSLHNHPGRHYRDRHLHDRKDINMLDEQSKAYFNRR